MSGESLALTFLAGARWITDLGIVWLVGVAGLRVLGRRAGLAEAALDRRLARSAGLALVLLLVATAARLWAQTYSAFGLDEPVTGALIRLVAAQTRWGERWMLQAGAAVAAAACAALLSTRLPGRWPLFGMATLGVVGTAPLTGHAMAVASIWPLLLQVLHLAAAGVWLGTLGLLLTAGLASVRAGDGGTAPVAGLVDRFSPVALGAAATVAGTGVLTATLYLGAAAPLWETVYGRVLLLKTGLFLMTAACGAYNWKRVRPRLAGGAGVPSLRRVGGAELTVAVVLLAVTAWLVHLPLPGE